MDDQWTKAEFSIWFRDEEATRLGKEIFPEIKASLKYVSTITAEIDASGTSSHFGFSY
jgi:hypothetical protein